MLGWIDTYITESNIQDSFKDLLVANGWSLEKDFYKIIVPKKITEPKVTKVTLIAGSNIINLPPDIIKKIENGKALVTYNGSIYINYTLIETGLEFDYYPTENEIYEIYETNYGDTDEFNFIVAHHQIYKNLLGQMFGFALISEFNEIVSKLPNIFTVINNNVLILYNKIEFLNFVQTYYNDTVKKCTWYLYMLEQIPNISNNDLVIITCEDENNLKRLSLDIEIYNTYWEKIELLTNYTFNLIIESLPEVKQSPIITANIRNQNLESYYDKILKMKVQYTNWWNDSKIKIKGQINNETICIIIRSDLAPAFEGNKVSTIPFYFGSLDYENEIYKPVVLFTGTTPDSSDFNFDDPEIKQNTILPMLKNYPLYPSNGIDTIMISRTINGSYYQECFFSWNTLSNKLLPDRIGHDNYKYPRAWTAPGYENNEEYMYQFNPSRYSDEIISSKLYVIHPEEGVIGTLKNCIACSPLSLLEEDKLQAYDEYCPNVLKTYHFVVIDGISPLTKLPGTPYRPIGFAILES